MYYTNFHQLLPISPTRPLVFEGRVSSVPCMDTCRSIVEDAINVFYFHYVIWKISKFVSRKALGVLPSWDNDHISASCATPFMFWIFSLPHHVNALALYLTASERHEMDVTCSHGRELCNASHQECREGKIRTKAVYHGGFMFNG